MLHRVTLKGMSGSPGPPGTWRLLDRGQQVQRRFAEEILVPAVSGEKAWRERASTQMWVPCCEMGSQSCRGKMAGWMITLLVEAGDSQWVGIGPYSPSALGCRMAQCTVQERDLFYFLSQKEMPGQGRGSESMSFSGGGRGWGAWPAGKALELLQLGKGPQWGPVPKNPWKF